MLAPLVAWGRFAPTFQSKLREQATAYALNAAVIARMRPCDVFICMSGMYLEAAVYARRRYGAQIWLERGSRHILSQAKIMANLGLQGPSDFIVERELEGYETCDRLVIPSTHVVESFQQENSALLKKAFINPYGVHLQQFPLRREKPRSDSQVHLITVGGWSYRKGADLLTRLVEERDDLRLTHVGGLGDAAFPSHPRLKHIGSVPQQELTRYYEEADIYVQASREEGLAVVQAQALASGLPLVCSHNSGGGDLGHSEELTQRIRVVETDDIHALEAGIDDMISRLDDLPVLSSQSRQLLGWEAYGKRYSNEIISRVN